MILIYLSIAWITGIYLGSQLILPVWILAAGVLPLILIPFFHNYRKKLAITGCIIIVLTGGLVFSSSNRTTADQTSLQFYNDSGIKQLQGMIDTEPEMGDNSLSFQLSAQSIYIGSKPYQISGQAIVKTSKSFDYHYGDIIKLTGTIETPQSFDDFNYKEYLSQQKIYSLISYPAIEQISRNHGSPLLSAIYTLRNNLSQSLARTLPEPQCALAQGILLGLRGSIPNSLKQDFTTTGTTHLLAISGLNLSIIIGILLSLGIWLFGKQHSIYVWLALLVIWLYSILTGMKPPIIRSVIMGSMFLIAELLGRQRSAGTGLAFSAAIMVGINNEILGDASFQLSFLSMAGLAYIYPQIHILERKFMHTTTEEIRQPQRFITESILITIAAMIATWPVVAYHFNIVSLSGIPATFFALPSMLPIIITTALTSLIGLFLPIVALVFGWIAWPFLSYFIFIIQSFAALPFSWISITAIPLWVVWTYYILLIVILITLNYRVELVKKFDTLKEQANQLYSNSIELISKIQKKYFLYPLLLFLILTWAAIIVMPDDNLHVSILNVGQGDAILIQTPNHQNILIDGGPSPQALKLELGKKLPFWQRTIDLVIITQPQADHITGIVEILQYYDVKQVMESGIPYNSQIHTQLMETLKQKRIQHQLLHSDQQITIDKNISIDVIYPPQFIQCSQDEINDYSVVLRLNYDSIHFLFTGDISKDTESYLMAQRSILQSNVLKVAHHGSRESTSTEFLNYVQPDAAAISAGANNRFGHPHPDTIQRLIQSTAADNVFITSQYGTIEFISDSAKIWVKTGH